jgi:hypothetical protein
MGLLVQSRSPSILPHSTLIDQVGSSYNGAALGIHIRFHCRSTRLYVQYLPLKCIEKLLTAGSDCIVGEVSSTRLRSKTVGLARNGYNVVGIVAGVLNTYMMNPLAVSLDRNLGFRPEILLTFVVELERARGFLLGEPRSHVLSAKTRTDIRSSCPASDVWSGRISGFPSAKAYVFLSLCGNRCRLTYSEPSESWMSCLKPRYRRESSRQP